MRASPSIDQKEVTHFSEQPQDWWNPDGAWSPLHKINPARCEYIRKTICDHFSSPRDIVIPAKASIQRSASARRMTQFKNLSILDIGCGGGLLCEPLARLGAKVTGLDASPKTLEAARKHAKQEKLDIAYIDGSVEDYAQGKQKFDVVLAMEILEHVADIPSFLKSAASLLKPNGLLIVSTVNRTTKSYLLGIVVAEYILGWVPAGMHDWDKFIRPFELAAHLEKAGLKLIDLMGMVYNPLTGIFSLRQGKVGVNYLATAIKGGG
ncbi:MAG: bifunctional 2-polyprenyl-6-hydroxyphenol methylase/3-demethylubiquinol 3-O-methyltransferase UbiG [Bdellovibrionales bacterium]